MSKALPEQKVGWRKQRLGQRRRKELGEAVKRAPLGLGGRSQIVRFLTCGKTMTRLPISWEFDLYQSHSIYLGIFLDSEEIGRH